MKAKSGVLKKTELSITITYKQRKDGKTDLQGCRVLAHEQTRKDGLLSLRSKCIEKPAGVRDIFSALLIKAQKDGKTDLQGCRVLAHEQT